MRVGYGNKIQIIIIVKMKILKLVMVNYLDYMEDNVKILFHLKIHQYYVNVFQVMENVYVLNMII